MVPPEVYLSMSEARAYSLVMGVLFSLLDVDLGHRPEASGMVLSRPRLIIQPRKGGVRAASIVSGQDRKFV
jgi:hypothetical protein